MGAADVFAMAERYQPADGIRQLISGTPPIVGMLPMRDMLALIDQAGMPAVRRKSVALTGFAVEVADALLAPHGVAPRLAARPGRPRRPRHARPSRLPAGDRRAVAARRDPGLPPAARASGSACRR